MLEDPHRVADQLDQFLGLQLYTGVELMSLISILLSGEERGMIRSPAVTNWAHEHPAGPEVPPACVKLPNQEPQWDNNNEIHRGHTRDLRDLIKRGLREAVAWSQNIAKVFNTQQRREEGPTEFLNRLKGQMRKYSGLDVDDSLG